MKKYDWGASESAPEGYPMEVVRGNFHDREGGSLYVPNGVFLHNGWGKGRSSHVVGPLLKPLPDKLEITFFSYLENQFYQGEFRLPYETILQLFNDGYFSPNEEESITFDEIVTGTNPGGGVSVWLRGIDKTTEVFRGHADKIEGDWNWVYDLNEYTREEYVRDLIEGSIPPETYEAIKKNGIPFDLWDKYRTQYAWQPLVTGMPLRDDMIRTIEYFNGEKDYLYYPLKPSLAAATRPIPKAMRLIWAYTDKKGLLIELDFNEEEIFAAFKALSANKEALQLEMRIERPEGRNDFSVRLKNDREEILLKRANLKTYAAKPLE